MQEKRISIGWNRCIVYEVIRVKRCFKCQGYNHISENCRNKKSCRNCGDEHDMKECECVYKKCVNCVTINEKFNTQFAYNHSSNDPNCPIFLRKLEQYKRNINYDK